MHQTKAKAMYSMRPIAANNDMVINVSTEYSQLIIIMFYYTLHATGK